MTNMAKKGTVRGTRLLHRLEQMADGVDEHGKEPDFPNYFARVDIHAERDEVAGAMMDASEADTRFRTLIAGFPARRAEAEDLYARAVGAVESYFGVASPELMDFGIRPRKGRYSPHSKLSRAGHKKTRARRKARAAAKAAGGAA